MEMDAHSIVLRCCLVVILMLAAVCKASTNHDILRETILRLYKNYDKNIRPTNNVSTPLEVEVELYIASLSGISERNMEFKVNMYLRQRWRDSRLASSDFTPGGVLINSQISQTWLPDIFIENDKVSKKSDVTTDNAFLRVNKRGDLVYSLRLTSTVDCDMDLQRYPFDVQNCKLKLSSYGQLTSELTFRWKGDNAQIDENIKLPEHFIVSHQAGNCTRSFSTGSFSCVSVDFVFKRNVNYYIMGVFVPSCMIVVLSWVGFWIDKASTPGRVSLSIITILTMQNQMSSALSQLPKVSYIKLVDAWLTGCLAFVVGGFLEYALVNTLSLQEKRAQEKTPRQLQTLKSNRARSEDLQMANVDDDEVEPVNNNNHLSVDSVPLSRKFQKARGGCCGNSVGDKVDYYSRFLFPLAFLIFNVVFWPGYLAV